MAANTEKPGDASEETRFKGPKDALAYLQDQKYKIEKSKLYQDCRPKNEKTGKGGLIPRQADGSILKSDLDRYAKTLTKFDPDAGMSKDQRKKLKAEAKRADIEAKRAELKYRKEQEEVILKADAELERANNASAIFVALSNGMLSAARELIEACAGDQRRVESFIEAVKRELERVANSLSKMEEFEIIFDGARE